MHTFVFLNISDYSYFLTFGEAGRTPALNCLENPGNFLWDIEISRCSLIIFLILAINRVANEYMCVEKNRLESFATCPINKTWPTTDRLAHCGFYWVDQRQCVVCFCCGCEISEWETCDQDVQQKHR